MEILPLTNGDKHNDHIDAMTDAYASLYNSLGVEPGLLSKTDIGKNLNNKFGDNEVKPDINNYKIKSKDTSEKDNTTDDAVVLNIPLFNPSNVSTGIAYGKYNIEETIDYSLQGYINEYVRNTNKSEEDLLNELKTFIKERFNYRVIPIIKHRSDTEVDWK